MLKSLQARIAILQRVAITFLLSLMFSTLAQAQGDGPRAYFPVPTGTKIVTGHLLNTKGNQSYDASQVYRDADLDVSVGVAQFNYVLDIKGYASGLLVVAPLGEVEGNLQIGNQQFSSKSSGLGDIQLGFVLGLAGVPALTREEYVEFNPTYAVGLVARWITDSGEYDSGQAINLGSNRNALQLALPLAWYLGNSFLDPALTTFEIIPSVTWFTDNDDPSGADNLGQDALYKLEAHLTRNLNRAMWVSLDANYIYGGETSTDGVSNDNRQGSLGVGATFLMNFSQTLSVQASYGETVSHNTDGVNGKMFRMKFTKSF